MRADCKTARTYLEIDKLIRKIEQNQLLKKNNFPIYSKNAFVHRVMQILAYQITEPLLRLSIKKPLSGNDNALFSREISIEGMKINPASGEIDIKIRLILASFFKFLALWFVVLGSAFKQLFLKSRSERVILIHGVPNADLHAEGNATRFENFCKNGQLEILKRANKYIVHAAGKIITENSKNFIYARIPLLRAFQINPMCLLENINFIFKHFKLLGKFLVLLFEHPIACLLWRDFCFHSMASSLNERNLLQANIITNTNWFQQYLWMSDLPNRSFDTFMALYSLNSSGFLFKDDSIYANHPSIRHLRADLIYIWDSRYEKILSNEGINIKTEVVSPILWYLPSELLVTEKTQLRVSIFDVSPASQSAMLNRGVLGHYYNTDTMKKFLRDIKFVINQVQNELRTPIEVILKHKRTPGPIHDPEYFKYVREYCKLTPNLALAAEDCNLFDLIAGSHLVIVIPYSSPALIANFLNVPAIYFDPSGELISSDAVFDPIIFCDGVLELQKQVQRLLQIH